MKLSPCLVLCSMAAVFVHVDDSWSTPLDDYVSLPDPAFQWALENTIQGQGYTAYVLDMTSQSWRSASEVDRTEWQHWVRVIQPHAATSGTALLWIDGGSNDSNPPAPTTVDPILELVALQTGSVVVDLSYIPNQRLKFSDEADPRYVASGRTEDEIIAYTWDKFLRTGDATWPLQLPMTKAAVRAMDAVQQFMPGAPGGALTIDDFVVGGGSKRGWATWTTAAVDSRVRAILPAVIDVLNVEPSLQHHHDVYGFWSWALQDYVDMGITDWIDTPEMAALLDIVDPYSYRERYTMPKYVVNATGDEFFLPDSSQFYFDDLPGPKYLRYVPNASHSLSGSDAAVSLVAFHRAMLADAELPAFSWSIDGNTIIVESDEPVAARLWQATNPTARDFRLNPDGPGQGTGPQWTSTLLADTGGGVFVGAVEPPFDAWTAFLVELEFDSGVPGLPYKFTTPVQVIPEPAALPTIVALVLCFVRRMRCLRPSAHRAMSPVVRARRPLRGPAQASSSARDRWRGPRLPACCR